MVRCGGLSVVIDARIRQATEWLTDGIDSLVGRSGGWLGGWVGGLGSVPLAVQES